MLNFDLNTTQMCAILALQLGVIIFAAKFCGDLVKKMKMPSVLGELAAGILIGPYVLGGIPLPFHGLHDGLFAFASSVNIGDTVKTLTFSDYHSSLYAFATIGSVILLFLSGLETDLRMFFRYSVVGTVVGLGGVIFSYAFGVGVGMYFYHAGFMDPRCMFLGILCTATSVGITARILSEKKKVDSPEGVTILAAAVIDDVLGIICLAVVLGIVNAMAAGSGASPAWGDIGLIALKCFSVWLGATCVGLILARYIAKFLRIFKSPAVFATLALGLALLIAGLFEQSGLAMIIGAYVMGLSLSKTDVSFAIQHALHPLYAFFVPVFFVVMGMLVDIRVFADPDTLKIGLIYTVVAVLAKVIGCALPALFMNFNMLGSLRIGAGMIPRGEVALIIAGIGAGTMMKLSSGEVVPVLDSKLFGVAIIMTLGTTIVAPPLLSVILGLKGKGVKKETYDTDTVHTPFQFPSHYVADMVFQRMVETFEAEGWMMSTLDKENNVLQLRKDTQSFAMVRNEKEFVFESNPHEVPFINAVMYETFVDLHQVLAQLKDLTSPKDVQKDFFEAANDMETASGHSNILHKVIHPSCICMDLKADTKEGVFSELLRIAEKNTKAILDPELCLKDLLERETVVTTCMQSGLAMPHARTEGVKDMVAVIGFHKQGYTFDALDGQPTRVFVLCLSSKDSNGPHIEFVSSVAGLLAAPEGMEELLRAQTPEEVCAFFTAKHKKA